MSAVPSSSTRNPIDTTLIAPSRARPGRPARAATGTVVRRDLALGAAEPSFDAEHARHAEAPDVGVEHADGEARVLASAAARLTVTDDLPTPPLPLATASTRVVDGTSVGAACSRALKRARCIAAVFCAGVISPYSTFTPVTPGRPRTFDSTSRLICARSGHPAVVSATVTLTWPSGDTRISSTIPRSTTLAPSSGSITPPRMPRTSSADGGGPATGSWTGAPGSSGSGCSKLVIDVRGLACLG